MILIFSSIFYFLFAQLSIALANKLLIKLPNNSNIKYNEYIYNAASFIIGISISIIFISFLNIFIGLFLSIITYLIISLIILKFKPFNINKSFFKDYFILLFIIFLQIAIALIPLPEYFSTNIEKISPLDGFGSIVHSFRAGNISIFMFLNNYIPRINQNIGQSFFASLPSFFKLHYPQINLIIWKSIVLLFFYKLIFGIVSKFSIDKFKTIITLSFFFIQTALSFTYVQTIDTGSTLIFCANADTLICIFSFIIFILLIFDNVNNFSISHQLLFIILFYSWNLFGAQNILIASVVLFYLALKNNKQYKFLSFLFISTILFALTFGGLLSPFPNVDSSMIPGLMKVKNSAGGLIELRKPSFTHFAHYEFHNNFINNLLSINPNNLIQKLLLTAYKSLFAIIIGLIAIYSLLKFKKIKINSDLFYILLIITAIGLFSNTFFKFYGQVWELSRFYYLGNIIFIFSIFFVFIFRNNLNISRNIWVTFFYLISILPCFIFFVLFLNHNINDDYNYRKDRNGVANGKTLSISKRFYLLHNFNSYIGSSIENKK